MNLLQYFPNIINENDILSIPFEETFDIDGDTVNRLALLSNNPIEFINMYNSNKKYNSNLFNLFSAETLQLVFKLCKYFNRIPSNKKNHIKSNNQNYEFLNIFDYLEVIENFIINLGFIQK